MPEELYQLMTNNWMSRGNASFSQRKVAGGRNTGLWAKARPMNVNEDAPIEGHDSQVSNDDDDENEAVSLTPSARELLLAERDHTCTLCGSTPEADDTELNVHHKQPKSEGGSDHPQNRARTNEPHRINVIRIHPGSSSFDMIWGRGIYLNM